MGGGWWRGGTHRRLPEIDDSASGAGQLQQGKQHKRRRGCRERNACRVTCSARDAGQGATAEEATAEA